MKKKNIGYILFGQVGMQLIGSFIVFFIILPMYESLEIPTYQLEIIYILLLIFDIVSISIIIIGLILVIKFCNE